MHFRVLDIEDEASVAFSLKITKRGVNVHSQSGPAFSKEGLLSARKCDPVSHHGQYVQCSGKRALSLNVAGMEELKREGHSLLFADRIPTRGKEGSTAKE